MKTRSLTLWLAALLPCVAAAADPARAVAGQPDRKLWFAQAAGNWETHALPLGNGPMGCMVFGGIDKEQLQFNDSLTDMQKRLVGPRVGKWGQLQEWMEDRDDPKDDHRHTSHLFAVYPGRQISPAETPEFAMAAAVSLEARGETGDARRSWTWPWRCAIWARLGQGDKAAHMIDGLIQYNLLPNMIATHPPLQLDGSFGIVAGMCEMLVQSHAGQIQLLPALPAAWPNGSVTGLRARGGFEVGIEWKDGTLVAATVKSLTGNKCRVAYGKETRELEISPGKTSVVRF